MEVKGLNVQSLRLLLFFHPILLSSYIPNSYLSINTSLYLQSHFGFDCSNICICYQFLFDSNCYQSILPGTICWSKKNLQSVSYLSTLSGHLNHPWIYQMILGGCIQAAEQFIDVKEKIMKWLTAKARSGLFSGSHYFYSKTHPEICCFWWFISQFYKHVKTHQNAYALSTVLLDVSLVFCIKKSKEKGNNSLHKAVRITNLF